MYYSISGKLVYKDDQKAVIDTSIGGAGIAYEVMIGQSTFQMLPDIGQNVMLYVSLLLRENEIFLVGFTRSDEKRFYESLVTVSGVGPRHGLRILSELSTEQIRNAIIAEDTSVLSRVKGIGKKTAERIILELRDRIIRLSTNEISQPENSRQRKRMEVLLAMRVLGYGDNEVRSVIDKVFETEGIADMELEDIIKQVLSRMVK